MWFPYFSMSDRWKTQQNTDMNSKLNAIQLNLLFELWLHEDFVVWDCVTYCTVRYLWSDHQESSWSSLIINIHFAWFKSWLNLHHRVRIAQLVEHQTFDYKVASLDPSRSSRGMFFSGVNFLCSLIQSPFHTHFTAVACKRSQPFCLKCRWQVTLKMHAYTLDPTKSRLADCCPGIVMEPIRQTSSLTGHKGRLCHSHLSSLSPL